MNLRRHNCRTVRNMLPLHVGGDLDPRHVPAVDRHLSTCLPCFREFGELSAMRARLAVLAEQPLPAGILAGFTDEVMARIAVGEPGPVAHAPRPGPRPVLLPRLAAAAAVLLVAMAGWRLTQDGGTLARHSTPIQAGSSPVTEGNAWIPSRATDSLPVRVVTAPTQRAPAALPPSAGEVLAPVSTIPHPLLGTDTVPDAVEVQLRLRGGLPAGALIMRTGTGSNLQLDEGRQPRARNP